MPGRDCCLFSDAQSRDYMPAAVPSGAAQEARYPGSGHLGDIPKLLGSESTARVSELARSPSLRPGSRWARRRRRRSLVINKVGSAYSAYFRHGLQILHILHIFLHIFHNRYTLHICHLYLHICHISCIFFCIFFCIFYAYFVHIICIF